MDRFQSSMALVLLGKRLLLLVLIIVSLASCTSLFFQPRAEEILTPARLGLAYEDVFFPSSDGTKLHGWFLPAQGTATGTVIFLHGNSENISTHIGNVFWLPASHFNVFMFDYRGYGQSEGRPQLEGVLDDIESAFRVVVNRHDLDPKRLVILGQSLGGTLAIYAATHTNYRKYIKAVVVDSAFSSYRQITQEKLGDFWLTRPFQWPLSLPISDAYSPLKTIGALSPIPLLIIHSTQDQIIPVHHALQLFQAAEQPKQMWILHEGKHIQTFNNPENRVRLAQYLTNLLPAQSISTARRTEAMLLSSIN